MKKRFNSRHKNNWRSSKWAILKWGHWFVPVFVDKGSLSVQANKTGVFDCHTRYGKVDKNAPELPLKDFIDSYPKCIDGITERLGKPDIPYDFFYNRPGQDNWMGR